MPTPLPCADVYPGKPGGGHGPAGGGSGRTLCAGHPPGRSPLPSTGRHFCALARQAEPRLTVRQAVFAPQETIPAGSALGRVCALPTVSCPPAIPIVVSGEVIGPAALELFAAYGVETVSVVKPERFLKNQGGSARFCGSETY